MIRFRGENPVYKRVNYADSYSDTEATYGGVVQKTALLLGIVGIVALYFANSLNLTTITVNLILPIIAAPIIAIISIIVVHRNPSIAWIGSIIYAIAEGVFLGFISALYAAYYGGEIIQMALLGTFGVLGGMLFLFTTGVIRVGTFFKRFMYSALIGLLLTSVVFMIIVFAAGVSFESFYTLYVGIAVISTIISSLFLLIDFDRIQNYVDSGAGREYEWSLALGLIVTIVWIYVELLRLISIITRRFRR